jgi:2-hydroxy-6-oxonona-2,4-dienedioate hydrolase
MPEAVINGGKIRYELLGDGPPITLTPGGRFGMDIPGLRPLAERLAPYHTVLLWDRPNSGASDVKFTGESESQMYADDLAALLRHLDLAPAVIAGGSAGSRVSVLVAITHPEVTSKLVVWMMSGGVFGTMFLAMNYLLPFMATVQWGGMEAVAAMPQWQETIQANPSNAQRLASLDPDEFLAVLGRWLEAYIPRDDHPLPGVSAERIERITAPTLVIRNGKQDLYHPEQASLDLHRHIPGAVLADPPWGEDEWNRVKRLQVAGKMNFFDDWYKLAPQILQFTAGAEA